MAAPAPGLALVLVDIALIVVVCQLLGELLRRLGQPRVLGEILGGIVLGPSVLGALAPQLQQTLFGAESVASQLNLLGQLGLILFMFLVGLEMNPALLQGKLPLASRLSLVGVLLPLGLGIALASALERIAPELLPGEGSLPGFLFMGVAMAITAFPVLSRILRERGLMRQPLGQLAISTAAVDDVLGWLLLAAVVAFTRSGSFGGALPALVGTMLWAFLLLVLARPLMAMLEHHYRRRHQLGPLLQSSLLAGAILSAVVCDRLGVHLVIGAFLWGLALPRYGPLQQRLKLRLEAVVLTVLLPMFFAISGITTEFQSLDSPSLWLVALLVLAVAVGCKFVGIWGTARLSGVPPREAQAMGWLMNTRGLTELVILNVGHSLGVISTPLFTMMVLMALVTTAMAGPLLNRLGYPQLEQA
ncbi:MAG: cation:proton antiporter [Cyanobacteriota bacterium]